MREIVLRRRPFWPRLWRLYTGYRRQLGMGRMQALACAWRSARARLPRSI